MFRFPGGTVKALFALTVPPCILGEKTFSSTLRSQSRKYGYTCLLILILILILIEVLSAPPEAQQAV